jgi:hypothetical protein
VLKSKQPRNASGRYVLVYIMFMVNCISSLVFPQLYCSGEYLLQQFLS